MANDFNAPGTRYGTPTVTPPPSNNGGVNSQFTQYAPTPTGALPAAPTASPTTTPTAPANGVPTHLAANPGTVAPTSPDAGFSQAQANLSPSAPPSEEDFWNQLYGHFAPLVSSINATETAAEQAAYNAGSQGQVDLNASLGSRGLAGSSEAANLNTTANLGVAASVAQARQAQSTALNTALTYLTGAAHTEFTDAQTRNDTMSQNYVTAMQSNALATIKGIAESGITSGSDLQSKNPQAYSALLQYYNGDPNALNSALVMNQPTDKIIQSWANGSQYYQLVTDPITGKPKVQTMDLGVNVPPNYQATKVNTTTTFFQDSSNPSNTLTITSNPFTGGATYSGTGDGATLANQYNQQSASSTTTNPTGDGTSTTTDNSGPGTASTTVSSILGVDPTTPLSDVISTVGVQPLVSAMIQNEGSSPAGVKNNPGNVKFTGASGQTDSGVKASDGGTFASYASPQDGQKAIADLITSAASGQSPAYGAAPTLQSFVGKYTNTGTSAPSTGSNGLPTGEYGLLSNVQGFNPTVPGVDQSALNYLKEYLTQGKTPSAASVGISTRTGSGAMFNTVAQRADDVYFQATGQHLPDANILSSNKKLISGNNSILNNLSLQEGTISANAGLLINKVDAANLNTQAPTINKVIDSVKNSLGNVDTASLLAQSSTLQNELGSLLALKNATGTTVHDKLESAGLIDSSYNADQIASVVNTLMQEATNSHAAITTANGKLYAEIDPLQLDPQNPLSNPNTFASSVGIDLQSILNDNPGLTPQQVIQQYLDSN